MLQYNVTIWHDHKDRSDHVTSRTMLTSTSAVASDISRLNVGAIMPITSGTEIRIINSIIWL